MLGAGTVPAAFRSSLSLGWLDTSGDSAVPAMKREQHVPFQWQHHHWNRRFPEITGEDNLTMFSYAGRVKSPEWRRQWRRASLQQFQIFRHRPILIYTRLPAWETYYLICMFPTNSECLISISDAFSAFRLWVSIIFHVFTVPPTKAYSLCAACTGMNLYMGSSSLVVLIGSHSLCNSFVVNQFLYFTPNG